MWQKCVLHKNITEEKIFFGSTLNNNWKIKYFVKETTLVNFIRKAKNIFLSVRYFLSFDLQCRIQFWSFNILKLFLFFFGNVRVSIYSDNCHHCLTLFSNFDLFEGYFNIYQWRITKQFKKLKDNFENNVFTILSVVGALDQKGQTHLKLDMLLNLTFTNVLSTNMKI